MSEFNTKVYRKPGGDELVVADGGRISVEPGGEIVHGGAGAVAGVEIAAVESGPALHVTRLTITDLVVAMTDATTAGSHGSEKLYDFPAGNILVLGVVSDLQIVAGAGGIGDTAAVVGSIGSAAVGTDNATLTSTEANLMPSTAATLSSGAGNCDGASTATATLDGTDTPAAAYLNLAVPDAGSSANDTLTVNGTVQLTWLNLGDN